MNKIDNKINSSDKTMCKVRRNTLYNYLAKTFELRERLKLFRLEKSVVSAGK